MASVAKVLLWTHLCGILLFFAYGVSQIADAAVMTSAVGDWNQKYNPKLENGSSVVQPVVSGIVSLFFPIGMFILVRNVAIQQNSEGVMQGTCLVDGCCSCLACCGLTCSVCSLSAISLGFFAAVLNDPNVCACSTGTTTSSSSMGPYSPTPGPNSPLAPSSDCENFSTADCQAAVSDLRIKGIFIEVLQIAGGLLMAIQICVCAVGAAKAHEGYGKLARDYLVFCGAPRRVHPAHQGTLVVGHPVSGMTMTAHTVVGPCVMGHPVQAAPTWERDKD